MPVGWEHKLFPKENNAQGLCFGLVGAEFNSIKFYGAVLE